MTDVKTELITKEELVDAVVHVPVYRTADFEFVAVALALQTPPVRLTGKEAFDHPTMRGGQLRRKYLFLLTCPPTRLTPTWESEIEALALKYVNADLLVEPTSVAGKRKYLRGFLYDTDTAKKQKEK